MAAAKKPAAAAKKAAPKKPAAAKSLAPAPAPASAPAPADSAPDTADLDAVESEIGSIIQAAGEAGAWTEYGANRCAELAGRARDLRADANIEEALPAHVARWL